MYAVSSFLVLHVFLGIISAKNYDISIASLRTRFCCMGSVLKYSAVHQKLPLSALLGPFLFANKQRIGNLMT